MDVLLDTHAWVWSLVDDPRLSETARAAIGDSEAVRVSPISFFEIGQKVRIGKWPEMEQYMSGLPDMLEEQGGLTAALTSKSALMAAMFPWTHRDPFDRIIAATAISLGSVLVSADAMFDTLQDPKLRRLW